MDILFCISQNEDLVYCFFSIIESINSSGVVLTEVMDHSLRDIFLQPLWFFFLLFSENLYSLPDHKVQKICGFLAVKYLL